MDEFYKVGGEYLWVTNTLLSLAIVILLTAAFIWATKR